jgi:hypothetical protein
MLFYESEIMNGETKTYDGFKRLLSRNSFIRIKSSFDGFLLFWYQRVNGDAAEDSREEGIDVVDVDDEEEEENVEEDAPACI